MSDTSQKAQPETVVCVATHPIDLADGRSLEPGERAASIDVNDPYNAQLIEAGSLLVAEAITTTKPKDGSPPTPPAPPADPATATNPGA